MRRSDIEAWMVLCAGRKSLHLEQVGADGCAMRQEDAVIYPLVRASMLKAVIDKLIAAQKELDATREALEDERNTVCIVHTNESLVASLRAEVAALKAAPVEAGA